MLVDFAGLLYGQVYDVLGTPLSFRSPNDGSLVTLTAIDKTAGAPISLHEIQTGTVKPCAIIRVSELVRAGIDYADIEGVIVTLNGEDWNVVSVQLATGPSGETDGEVYLMLSTVLD